MKVQGIDFEPMYTPQEVCAIFQICRQTLYRMCKRGAFPQPIRLSSTVLRFRMRDVQAYIEKKNEFRQ